MVDRITVDPNVCSGRPTIRGTRIMVKNILGMVAGGYTIERILEAYPELTREDVVAAVIVDQARIRVRPGRRGEP